MWMRKRESHGVIWGENEKTIEKSVKSKMPMNCDELNLFLSSLHHNNKERKFTSLENWIDFQHIFKISIISKLVSSSPPTHIWTVFSLLIVDVVVVIVRLKLAAEWDFVVFCYSSHPIRRQAVKLNFNHGFLQHFLSLAFMHSC